MCRTQNSPPREADQKVTKKCYKKTCKLFLKLFRFKNITILHNVAVTAVTSFKKKGGGTPGVIFKIKTTRTWGTFSREDAQCRHR